MSKRSFRRCSDPGIRHSSATDIPRNCASRCHHMCPVARVCDAQIARETVNVTSLIQMTSSTCICFLRQRRQRLQGRCRLLVLVSCSESHGTAQIPGVVPAEQGLLHRPVSAAMVLIRKCGIHGIQGLYGIRRLRTRRQGIWLQCRARSARMDSRCSIRRPRKKLATKEGRAWDPAVTDVGE